MLCGPFNVSAQGKTGTREPPMMSSVRVRGLVHCNPNQWHKIVVSTKKGGLLHVSLRTMRETI